MRTYGTEEVKSPAFLISARLRWAASFMLWALYSAWYRMNTNQYHLHQVLFQVGSLVYDAFSVTTLYSVDDMVISEWWWMVKDLVGNGHGLIEGTMLEFVWRHWGKPRKQSAQPAARAEIWTQDLPNTKQNWSSLSDKIKPLHKHNILKFVYEEKQWAKLKHTN
jgi:hypothetical protein